MIIDSLTVVAIVVTILVAATIAHLSTKHVS